MAIFITPNKNTNDNSYLLQFICNKIPDVYLALMSPNQVANGLRDQYLKLGYPGLHRVGYLIIRNISFLICVYNINLIYCNAYAKQKA